MPDNPEVPSPPESPSNAEPTPIEEFAQWTEGRPELFEKLVELLSKKKLCLECLGRQFSFLATGTDNATRAQALLLSLTMECHEHLLKSTLRERKTLFGKNPVDILDLLANRTEFQPAKQLSLKWRNTHPEDGSLQAQPGTPKNFFTPFPVNEVIECDLCRNLLSPQTIHSICDMIVEKSRGYEFKDFLIGTHLSAKLGDQEDEFRAQLGLQNGESFKANLNRLVGKQLSLWWDKPPKYDNPEITLQINLDLNQIKISVNPLSLFIRGRYVKYVRDLPQTHWHCSICRGTKIDRNTGQPCPECGGTGDVYSLSVQDLIGKPLLTITSGSEVILHGAGREDVDARCLGIGRPFIVEIANPKLRSFDLKPIENEINERNSNIIHVEALGLAEKQEVPILKLQSETSTKYYHALVYLAEPISQEDFNAMLIKIKGLIIGKPIYQRTPQRVVHRRADKTRVKHVLGIDATYIDPVHINVKVKAEGGTYIKELISGDNGRTSPSLAGIFGMEMLCVELDVVEIEYNSANS